jgi:hypothetical protein
VRFLGPARGRGRLLLCNQPNARHTRHPTQGSGQRRLQAHPGSSHQRRQRQINLRPYPAAVLRSEWDVLSVIKGLVVHDCKRIVIPSGARKATLQVLHRPHAGVAKTPEAARQLYFWPKMKNHVKDMVNSCERCQFYKASKQKQEQIQQTPFKDLYQMAEVGADLFEAGKQHFIIVVDRYSGFPLVAKPTSQRAEYIIGHMEKMFYPARMARRNQVQQRAMLQVRVKKLGQGQGHCSQQLDPKQAHQQQLS